MRSPLARLLLIGCILPEALGALVPLYVWRPPPTSSPTSSPSGAPSAQPSSHPSSSPSYQPTSSPSSSPSGVPTASPSSQPTSTPSFSPSYQPSLSSPPSSTRSARESKTSLRKSHSLVNADNSPSVFGFLLIFSLFLGFVSVWCLCRRKKKRLRDEDDDSEDNSDVFSFERKQATTTPETTAGKADNSDPQKRSQIKHTSSNDDLNVFNIGQAVQTRFQRALDTFTTQKRHVHFANKKKVQVYHTKEEPGMVAHEAGPEAPPPRPPTPILRPPTPVSRPSTPVPRRAPTPILRSNTPIQRRAATPIDDIYDLVARGPPTL